MIYSNLYSYSYTFSNFTFNINAYGEPSTFDFVVDAFPGETRFNSLKKVLFVLDLEQDKYMVSNPIAILGKSKDLISAFDAMVSNEEDSFASR